MFMHKATGDPFNLPVLVKLRVRDRVRHSSAGKVCPRPAGLHCCWHSHGLSFTELWLILSFHPEWIPRTLPSFIAHLISSMIFLTGILPVMLSECLLHFNRKLMMHKSLYTEGAKKCAHVSRKEKTVLKLQCNE